MRTILTLLCAAAIAGYIVGLCAALACAATLPADGQNPYLTIVVTDQAATPAEQSAMQLPEALGDKLRERLFVRVLREKEDTYKKAVKKTMPAAPGVIAQKADGEILWRETEPAEMPQTVANWRQAAEKIVAKNETSYQQPATSNCINGRCRPKPQPVKVDVPDSVKVEIAPPKNVPLDPPAEIPLAVRSVLAFLVTIAAGIGVTFIARIRRAV